MNGIEIKGNQPMLMFSRGIYVAGKEQDDFICHKGSKITFTGDKDSVAYEEFKAVFHRLKGSE